MATNRFALLALAILVIGGLSVSAYLFGKEDVQNVYNQLVNPPSKIQEPGPLSEDTLYQSFLSAPIDWNTEMAKLRGGNFNGSPFIADILSVNHSTKSLTLQFDFNYGGSLPQTQEITVKAQCPTERSNIVSSQNLDVIAEKTDIFSFINGEDFYVRQGDIIMSYCQDDACSTIGKECVLVRIEATQ